VHELQLPLGGKIMANEDVVKEAETQTLQEATRNLEEKIFDAKDATLRLSERTRHLQERVGGLESRVRFLNRLALGLLLGSVGAFAAIAKGQLSPLHSQVVALQESMGPLQAKLEEFDRTMKAGEKRETAAVGEARIQQLEKEVLESVKKAAPEILAATLKEEGHVPPTNAVGGEIVTPVGAVKGPASETLHIVVGKTDPQQTRWVQYSDGGIYVDIDTSSAGFSSTPYYFTSLGGHTNNWQAQGVTSIYLPTEKGFRVHVGHRELTATQAKEWGWYINWIAIGN
jgi:hypothetical protein